MKKLLSFAAALLLCSLLIIPALADDYSPCVRDYAGILTEPEDAAELEREAQRISERYGCAVYAVTVDSYTGYGPDVETAAENLYYSECPGINGNCVMLLLSMNERQYDLMAHGDIGNAAFTDYGKDLLTDAFLDDFRENDWENGLEDFVEGTERFLRVEAEGSPVDIPAAPAPQKRELKELLAPLALGNAVIGLIVTGISAGRMKSVRKKRGADEYVPRHGVSFTLRQDLYTHTTRTQRRIQTEQSRGGGSGGGTSINSGGFSHKSGSF